MSGLPKQLIKFCKEGHLPRKSNTLFIGNLEKYKNLENKEIEDAGEGTFEFAIELGAGTKIPTAWANLIFQGVFGFGETSDPIRLPGRISGYVEHVNIASVSDGLVTFKEARATINYTAPNAFLFCCSMGQSADPMSGNPFEGYDAFWQVSNSNSSLQEFSQKVGSLIHQQITLGHIDENLESLQLSKLGQFSVQIRHGPVNYVPRDLVITQDTDQNFEEMVGVYLNTPFCKPLSYIKEREYRFLFGITVGNSVFSVKNRDLILELNALFQPV